MRAALPACLGYASACAMPGPAHGTPLAHNTSGPHAHTVLMHAVLLLNGLPCTGGARRYEQALPAYHAFLRMPKAQPPPSASAASPSSAGAAAPAPAPPPPPPAPAAAGALLLAPALAQLQPLAAERLAGCYAAVADWQHFQVRHQLLVH